MIRIYKNCLITFLALFLSVTYAKVSFAQYCGGTFCSGGQSCTEDIFCNVSCVACAAGCNIITGLCNPTYTISGTVFVDEGSGNPLNDGNGVQNCSGACNNGAGDEQNYNGANVSVWGANRTTDASGSYSRSGLIAGTNNVTLTVPNGYEATTTNPRSVTLPPNSTVNFGIRLVPDPDCPGGLTIVDPLLNAGESTSASVTSCTDVEDPDNGNPPPPFEWDPPAGTNPQCNDAVDNDGDGLNNNADPGCHTNNDPSKPYNPTDDNESSGSDTCSDGGAGTPTSNATSSSVNYTAPTCPTSPLVCPVSVDVAGPGGTTTYSRNVTVAATYSITAHIREVTDLSGCNSNSGTAYTDSSVPINTTGGNLPVGGVTQPTSTGSTVFACLDSGSYTTTISVPSGYTLAGRSGGVNSGSFAIAFNPLGSNQTATFCIAATDPWLQTDLGDVRFLTLTIPVPTGKYASLGENSGSPQSSAYPGIFYSSTGVARLGNGSASSRNWVVNSEYDYNADTENRNGGMSYDFYKSKAKQDGISITPISSGTFVQNDIDQSQAFLNNEGGIFEANADLTINNYTHTNGKRIVILVDGNVIINDTSISIPVNQGLLIIAAKGNITIDDGIGTSTLNSTTTQLDGYYTAQGDIVLESIDNRCENGISDTRLNVGGALIAHSLKPFATTGGGSVQNNRSLCVNSLLYPSLYITSRPDFLVRLTDFYKTSYTKWKEENP